MPIRVVMINIILMILKLINILENWPDKVCTFKKLY